MTPIAKSLLSTFSIGILCFVIWKFSGIPLSYEMPPDYSIVPHPSSNSIKEKLVYFIFAILLSVCFYFPFYQTENYPDNKLLAGVILSTIFLFFLIDSLGSNTKGLLKSNWFGQDYGFSWKLVKAIFLAPIGYYIFNAIANFRLPLRSFVYLVSLTLIIYWISKFIGNPKGTWGLIPNLRYILVKGYFIFFYGIGFGLISIDANRKELGELKVDYIDDDDILDSNLDFKA